MKLSFPLYKDAMLTLQNILHHTDWSFESNWETKKEAVTKLLKEELGYKDDIEALLQSGYHSDLYQQTYDKINETQRFQTVILALFLAIHYYSDNYKKLLPILNHHFYTNGGKEIEEKDQTRVNTIYQRVFSLTDKNQIDKIHGYYDFKSKGTWAMAGTFGSFACGAGSIISIIPIFFMMMAFRQNDLALTALTLTWMLCGVVCLTACILGIISLGVGVVAGDEYLKLNASGVLLIDLKIDRFKTIALDKLPYVSIAPKSTLFKPVSDEQTPLVGELQPLVESAAAKSLYLKFGSTPDV